jgi:hypothetical protein
MDIITYDEMVQYLEKPNIKNTIYYSDTLKMPRVDFDFENYIETFKKQNTSTSIPEEITSSIINILCAFKKKMYIIKLEDFFNNLKIVFERIIGIINANIDKKYYVYYEDLSKSNFWISLLFVDHLLINHKDRNYNNTFVFFGNEYIRKNKNNMENIIYFDDCSYSGKQMTQNLQKSVNSNVYCVLPYLSKHALEVLTDLKIKKFEIIYEKIVLNIIDHGEIIDVLYNNDILFHHDMRNEFLKNIGYDWEEIYGDNGDNYDNYGQNNYGKNIDTFFLSRDFFNIGYFGQIICALFEHKLADSVSILQYMLNFLPEKITFNGVQKISEIYKSKGKSEFSLNYVFVKDFYESQCLDSEKKLLYSKKYPNFLSPDDTIMYSDEFLSDEQKKKYIVLKIYEENISKGLLKNCKNIEKKYVNYGTDYDDNELCYSPDYKNVKKIIEQKGGQLEFYKLKYRKYKSKYITAKNTSLQRIQ